jgi:putative transcriptional regulator
MSKAGESILRGLEEIKAYKQGEIKLRTRSVSIEPVPQYDAAFVRELRKELNLTQTGFASFFGVSKKTVEAWEMAKNKPSGAACRLMEIVKLDHEIPTRMNILRAVNS